MHNVQVCALIAGVAVFAAAHAEPAAAHAAIRRAKAGCAAFAVNACGFLQPYYVVQIAARAAAGARIAASPRAAMRSRPGCDHFDLPRNVAFRRSGSTGTQIHDLPLHRNAVGPSRDMIDVPRGQRETSLPTIR
jgi:hypothetical protein